MLFYTSDNRLRERGSEGLKTKATKIHGPAGIIEDGFRCEDSSKNHCACVQKKKKGFQVIVSFHW
uniref:Uncharacterized protein n=1 Tax=Anguilla anguilla TaxID=7936 RepID=A0A0E9V1L6_ANGAN